MKPNFRKLFKIFSSLCFLLCLFSCSKKNEGFIEAADSFLTETGFTGTVLVARKDRIIFAKGYGSTDKKNPDAPSHNISTVFETGSLTKQMTAACIMQLVEKGALSVEDSIDKFFPDYTEGKNITVKMLLNMRSGLTDFVNCPEDFFPANVCRQIEKKEISGEDVSRHFVLDYLNDAEPLTTPDSTYFYCNTNYYLLALIIEQISGITWEEYMQQNIFKKAGMNTANLEFRNTTSTGYTQKGKSYSMLKNMSIGLGDVNASVEDLLAWNLAFTGGKIVSRKSLREMIDCESYGYGIYRARPMSKEGEKKSEDSGSILHSGSTIVFNSYNEFLLKDRISIIVLCNQPQYLQNATLTGGKLKKLLMENNKN